MNQQKFSLLSQCWTFQVKIFKQGHGVITRRCPRQVSKSSVSIWKLCVVLMLSNKVISENILIQILHKIVTHGKAVLFQTILPSWYDQHAPDGVLRVTISHSRGRDGRVNSTGKVQLCLRGWPSLHSRGGGDGGLITHTSTTHTH